MSNPSSSPAAPARQACDILVVDDDGPLRNAVTAYLRRLGYTVESAGNGREALAMVERRAVRLVITDIFMPEIDGFELIMRLRRIHPDLAIVAMSGDGPYGPEVYLHSAQLLGVRCIQTKPVVLAELGGIVRFILSQAA